MKKKTTADFIADARKVHGSQYDYSKAEYVGATAKVCIICHRHGEFFQAAYAHLRGHGCNRCDIERRKCSDSDFFTRALSVHGTKYTYENVNYKSMNNRVLVTCVEHGSFSVRPADFLRGHGCKKCGYSTVAKKQSDNLLSFVAKAKEVHGDVYIYGNTKYCDSKTKVEVLCKKHGVFLVMPYAHIQGVGCPACANSLSKGENEVFELIKRHCPEAQQRTRDIIPPLELDIYIPSVKLAVEYNGEFWHSVDKKGKNYHLNKRRACEAVGVRLISVCETDWKTKRERVERIILNAIGKYSCKTVYARKCTISEVICKDYRTFMNENHIQGYAIAKHRYGLYDGDELVACMGFKQLKDGVWDCVRYATSCRVPGGHSRLFKFMAKELDMQTAQSFVDMDFFTGSSYREEDGWIDSGSETVGFRVWHQKAGFMPRQKWWKDFIPKTLEQLGVDPAIYDRNKKQREMMAEAGCLVIENSGNKKFVWHK